MNIKFLGAAETVTGSCYLVETDKVQFLIDCGMFQGEEVFSRNFLDFEFDAEKLDFVILTHAHMDHSGLIPKLFRKGFRGKVFMTPPTVGITELLLMDSAKIQEKSTNFKKQYAEILYDAVDVLTATANFFAIQFDEWHEMPNFDLSFKFIPAGHILGAASIQISLSGKNIVFSGDLGRVEQSIVPAPDYSAIKEPIDYVVMESLYGGIDHTSRSETAVKFITKVNETIDRNGNVIIPCFALHRSQELLELFSYASREGLINKSVQIILDSPLAISLTKLYTSYSSYFNDEIYFEHNNVSTDTVSGKGRFSGQNLSFSRTHRQSLRLLSRSDSVIISGSGMADGGRILMHLASGLGKKLNSVMFVGFQAPGTLGREIVDGATSVVINNKKIQVKAEIVRFDGFSGHAGNSELLKWLNKFDRNALKNVFLTHADLERSKVFSDQISQLGYNPIIPEWKSNFEL